MNEVDAGITANRSPSGLTAEDENVLVMFVDTMYTRVQLGNLPGARTEFDLFQAWVDGLAAKLKGDPGTQLKNAMKALDALLPPA